MTAPVILVVEDVPLNMMLIVSVLDKILPEASILEAVNGLEALEIAQRIRADLIIMDIQMPEMDGLEATRRIRHHEFRQGTRQPVPIVALTAYSLDHEREKCMTAGMNDFLTKPINMEVLRRMVNKYVNNQVRKQENDEASVSYDNNSHFDLKALVERTQVDETMLVELAKKGAAGLNVQMQVLHEAISEKSTDQIKKAAHAIKGVGLNLCFTILAKMARHMESLAEEDPGMTEQHYKLMDQEVLDVQKLLLGPNWPDKN